MAKNKAVNPAEAHRKAQRKKELAKNKDTRKKARELTTAKQDTTPIEEEIETLEAKGELTGPEKGKLSSLRVELARLRKAKEDYLKEHPEHRNLVYASSRKRNTDARSQAGPSDRNLFGKDGFPLHPERSIYYDAVMNPFGFPPPGMPYVEKPSTPEPVQEEPSSDSDDEDGIPMPPGSRPGASDSEDEDEDVQMPRDFVPPLPPGPPPPNAVLAPGFIPSYTPTIAPGIPPPPPFGVPPPPPLPMSGISQAHLPPLPPGFPSLPLNMPTPQAAANLPPGAIPPPPFGFPNFPPNFPPPSNAIAVPRGFRGSHAAIQPFDPLALPTVSGAPSKSQAHPSLPKRPPPPSSNTLAIDDNSSAATVSAAPELRDFKKEAMSFVPRGIRQKALDKGNTGVNAAPSTEDADSEVQQDTPRPDLMKTLAAAGITGRTPAVAQEEKKTAPQTTSKPSKGANKDQQDEYDRFMADIGDLI